MKQATTKDKNLASYYLRVQSDLFNKINRPQIKTINTQTKKSTSQYNLVENYLSNKSVLVTEQMMHSMCCCCCC